MIRAALRLAGLLAVTLLAGCGVPDRAPSATPEALAEKAQPAGFSDIRFWGDKRPDDLKLVAGEYQSEVVAQRRVNRSLDILALSGGGVEGAYAAGILSGWSTRGTRPEFDLVTGISTGALIAPFAFLGSAYDDRLRDFYTETATSDLVEFTPFKALFGGSALADTTLLKQRIAREVSPEVVAAIAREHKRGRRLYIGTTNLDAQRPVIWDIGRIASSGAPGAGALIHNIILASAAVPGGFPPVMIDVTVDGVRYQEMHVDGGVTRGIFVYPPELPMRDILARAGQSGIKRTFWLIQNARLQPEYQETGAGFLDISNRALDTLVKAQGHADLMEIQLLARRDGFAYRLTDVPGSFDSEKDLVSFEVYMSELFEFGRNRALTGSPWAHSLRELESGNGS